jgi:hypothetical protein
MIRHCRMKHRYHEHNIVGHSVNDTMWKSAWINPADALCSMSNTRKRWILNQRFQPCADFGFEIFIQSGSRFTFGILRGSFKNIGGYFRAKLQPKTQLRLRCPSRFSNSSNEIAEL